MHAEAILISVDDAAIMLSMTRRRLLRLIREGRVPFIDLGDSEPRFSPDELRVWIRGIAQQKTEVAAR